MTGSEKHCCPKLQKEAKGAFEAFRSSWLLQVAADRGAKSALPVVIVLACKYLNRTTGRAWPGIETLAAETRAEALNTVRSALKLLQQRGHALVDWTKGGKGKTNVVTPLVDGKPFKNLKGNVEGKPFNSMEGFDDATEAVFGAKTLQENDGKPFKNLKGNHLKKPLEEPIKRTHGPSRANASLSDADNSSWTDPHAIRDNVEYAPSTAPDGASGASDDHDEGTDWPSDYVPFLYDDDPADFVDECSPDLPIRAEPEDWRRLLTWVGAVYGPEAMEKAAEERRAGTLTIATIKNFRRRATDVA